METDENWGTPGTDSGEPKLLFHYRLILPQGWNLAPSDDANVAPLPEERGNQVFQVDAKLRDLNKIESTLRVIAVDGTIRAVTVTADASPLKSDVRIFAPGCRNMSIEVKPRFPNAKDPLPPQALIINCVKTSSKLLISVTPLGSVHWLSASKYAALVLDHRTVLFQIPLPDGESELPLPLEYSQGGTNFPYVLEKTRKPASWHFLTHFELAEGLGIQTSTLGVSSTPIGAWTPGAKVYKGLGLWARIAAQSFNSSDLVSRFFVLEYSGRVSLQLWRIEFALGGGAQTWFLPSTTTYPEASGSISYVFPKRVLWIWEKIVLGYDLAFSGSDTYHVVRLGLGIGF